MLWPQLTAADPAAAGLAELATEHLALDAALDALAIAPVQDGDDRAVLISAAETVRGTW